jgi:putative salt-induced outer membrane protein YdiY
MYALLLMTTLASAQDAEFVDPAEAGQKFDEPETHLSAELGGAWATGNVEYYTANGLLDASHRFARNQLTLGAGVNLGKGVSDTDGDGILSDAERSAEKVEIARKYWGDLRYDRFIGDKSSLYALGGTLSDIYAGYDMRSHGQVGYSRILVDTDSTDLKVELGVDVAHENYVDGIDPNTAMIYSGRAMASLTHQFNESVSFTDTIEAYENVVDPADLRVLNEAAISAKLSDIFSVKLSNQLTFDNVPVEGYRKLDQVTLVSLVATLL